MWLDMCNARLRFAAGIRGTGAPPSSADKEPELELELELDFVEELLADEGVKFRGGPGDPLASGPPAPTTEQHSYNKILGLHPHVYDLFKVACCP